MTPQTNAFKKCVDNRYSIFCLFHRIMFIQTFWITTLSGGGNIDDYLAAVLTAVVRFVFCIISCVLLLRMGRRTLGILSATGTAVASLVLAGYTLASKDNKSYIDVSTWTTNGIFFIVTKYTSFPRRPKQYPKTLWFIAKQFFIRDEHRELFLFQEIFPISCLQQFFDLLVQYWIYRIRSISVFSCFHWFWRAHLHYFCKNFFFF